MHVTGDFDNPTNAIDEVRFHYNPHAIETDVQVKGLIDYAIQCSINSSRSLSDTTARQDDIIIV
jgi:hypothetical protein